MKKLLVLVSSFLMLIASVSAVSACCVGAHQPEIPEALKKA